MRAIERRVCGCDYGGSSWTTRDEAERIGAILGLRPGLRLLDVGAGSGWPALYLAKKSGCDLALVDLPLSGLRVASQRALEDGFLGAVGLPLQTEKALLSVGLTGTVADPETRRERQGLTGRQASLTMEPELA